MGLDKAGKTSILRSLQGKTELSAFTQLDPTFGLNRAFIEDEEKEYTIFDFGGQEAYVQDYLSNLDTFLAGTDKVIFVFDMQDMDRSRLAMAYLDNILKYFDANGMKVPVSVFFHKVDRDSPEKLESLTRAAHELVGMISGMVPPGFEIEYYTTHLLTLFRKERIK